MTLTPGRVLVAECDITRLRVDAIINSIDPRDPGHSGLDAYIHRETGPRLKYETDALTGLQVSDVELTLAYRLPAKYIMHVVVPSASVPTEAEKNLLAGCYRHCLAQATAHRFRTVAFPVLGSGERGFTFALSATLALIESAAYLEHNALPQRVIVTVHDDRGAELSQLAHDILGYWMDEGWQIAGMHPPTQSPKSGRHTSGKHSRYRSTH